jgi:hypothetical protein
MACASQGTGLGRLFTCPHGLIPAQTNSSANKRAPLISIKRMHARIGRTKPTSARCFRNPWSFPPYPAEKRSPQGGTRVAVSERLVPPASPFAGAHACLRLSAPPSSGLDAPSGLMLWHLVSLIHMTQLITCLKDTKGCWNSKPGFKFQTYPILYSVDC